MGKGAGGRRNNRATRLLVPFGRADETSPTRRTPDRSRGQGNDPKDRRRIRPAGGASSHADATGKGAEAGRFGTGLNFAELFSAARFPPSSERGRRAACVSLGRLFFPFDRQHGVELPQVLWQQYVGPDLGIPVR